MEINKKVLELTLTVVHFKTRIFPQYCLKLNIRPHREHTASWLERLTC